MQKNTTTKPLNQNKMEKKISAVEWLVNVVQSCIAPDYIPTEIIEQAKAMENEKQRQNIIDFIGWMNNVASNNPMAFETDKDDIADMFLNGYYNFK
jgi:hypothetical protein